MAGGFRKFLDSLSDGVGRDLPLFEGEEAEPIVRYREPNPDELALGWAEVEDEKTGRPVLQLVGVSQEDRNAHFYVVGATRTGKTKLLEKMIEQDIKNGEGFGVIDPHGDLIEAVKERLALTPENLDERVVLIDPTNAECSVCFNPLELPEGVKSAELAAELVEVFEKIWSKAWGDRMADIFRNTLIALIENNLTLDEVLLFLTDAAFRAKLLRQVKNEKCREYFANEFNVLNPKTRSEWITSTSNKVRTFLSDERVRQIFLSPKSSFNFREIMDSGKILLVKLDKGRLKGASELLGSLILSKIQMAAFTRTNVRMSERKPFYLYIDEFQNFATDSFVETLAESAKYKLSLILVHQNLAQLPPELRASVLGNCNLQAYFRVARHDAELLAKEAFAGVYGDAPKWEGHIQQLQVLPNRVCVVKKNAGGMVFIRIPDITPAWQEAGMDESEFEAEVREAQIGERYVRRRDDIETEYRARMAALDASGEPENFRVKKAGEVTSYEEMIRGGENDEVEFKASLRWLHEQKEEEKPMEYLIVKAVSAFMNTRGGVLFIGVRDDGDILGIEKDYETILHPNKRDGFLLQLTRAINKYLGREFHQYAAIRIVSIRDKDICVVSVSRSELPVYLKDGDKEGFFIRATASSQSMRLREANEYIKAHFSKYEI
jgi:hypothetical protein